MLALAEAVRDGRISDTAIALVISNIETAAGLTKVSELGIPTFVHSHRGCTREEHDRAMAAELHRHSVDLVCLAGYMRLLSPWFIREFENRILNIHPSLLPAFPGLNAQQQALAVDVAHRQRHGFRDTQSGAIADHQRRPVAQGAEQHEIRAEHEQDEGQRIAEADGAGCDDWVGASRFGHGNLSIKGRPCRPRAARSTLERRF